MRASKPNIASGCAETGILFEQPLAPARQGTPPGAEGHRSRVRNRLMTVGPEALADHELLEALLFIALPRRDTKSIAKRILLHFGSFSAAISAPPAELMKVDDVGPSVVAVLKTVKAAAERLVRAELKGPILSNWDRLMDYLTAVMSREKVEQFRVLFLDNKNRLIADEVQGRGTVGHTPAYPREVVKRALELNASALLLAHNHPSGDPTPSADDVATTREIIAAARTLGVKVHDHVIVGNGSWRSLRQEGVFGLQDYTGSPKG